MGDRLIGHPFALALAWALMHFLWQGAVVGLAAAVLLRAAREVSASARYAIGVAAMAVMLVTPVATFGVIAGRAGDAGYTGNVGGAGNAGLAAHAGQADAPHAVAGPEVGRADPFTRTRVGLAVNARLSLLSLSLLLSAWLSGVLVLSLRLAGGWLVATRLARRAVSPVTDDVAAMADRVAHRLGLDRVVRVLESSVVHVPTVVGWLAPVVLVPAAALSCLAPAQLEALLAHEFAHIKRHDYLVNLLQSAVETLLFYHPAVWWVSRQVRMEREHCCDDIAVEMCGDRLTYVAALRDLETLRVTPSLALAASDGSLVARVRRLLLAPQRRPAGAPGWIGVALVTALVATLMPAAFVSWSTARAASEQQTPRNAPPAAKPAAPIPGARQTPDPMAPKIHAGDILRIVVEGESQLSRDYPVQRDGVIVFPLMRPLAVKGMTTDEVADTIAQTLAGASKDGLNADPDVTFQRLATLRWEVDRAASRLQELARRADALSSYHIEDPKVDIETSPILSEPEVSADRDARSNVEIMRALRSREDEFARSGQSNPDLDAWLNTRMLEQSKAARQSVQGVVKAAQADRDAAIAYRDDLAAQYRAVLADSRRRPTTSSAPKVTITIVKPPVADVPPPMIEPASGLRLAPAMVEPVDAAPTDAPESKSAPEQPVLPDGQVSSQATQTISIIGDVALPGSDLQTAPGTPVPTRVDDSKPQDGGSTVAPKAKTLLVTGEVKSPGPVGFTTGMTVKDAITAAGGVTERAATSRITITRLDPKTGKPTKIQAKDTTLVEADDVIMVPKRYF